MSNDISVRGPNSKKISAVINFYSVHKNVLIPLLEEAIASGVFKNHYVLHPGRLKELGKEEYDNLMRYLESRDLQSVRKLGRSRASERLGEQTILAIGALFRKFLCEQCRERISIDAGIVLIDSYINAYCLGFMEARESQILKDQELLRMTLSKAFEQQKRELLLKNHAIHTYSNGVMFTDMGGKIIYVNPAFVKMWRFEESADLLQTAGVRFFGLRDFRVLLEALEEKVGWRNKYTALRSDSTPFDVEVSASLIHDDQYQAAGIMASFIDVTDRNRLESQFRQVQKMEALGQLAGGIVHDFNNLLQVMSGFTELELRKIPKDSPQYQNLIQIKIACDRGKDLTDQLRFFTRQASGKHRSVDLNRIIDETVNLLKRTFPPGINIRVSQDSNLKSVSADPSQMSQMMLNLCVNARDAIVAQRKAGGEDGSEPSGTITLSTKNLEVDRRQAAGFLNAKPGQYVRILVRDTGAGISSEVRERLFDPFFTTKGERTGTGLGLAVVYGIVQKHGGFIDVKSQPGKGSTFELYFPSLESDTVEEPTPEPLTSTFTNGKGIILIVEDQEQVRNLAADTLKHCGYTVYTAENGYKGLKLFKEHAAEIDVVVLDVIMPKMGGRECFDEMKKIRPDVKVLIATGYTVDGSAQDFLKEGAIDVIEKPFDLDSFSRTINNCIER